MKQVGWGGSGMEGGVLCVCVCVSRDGLHAYTCMLTSIHPTRIVKQ
jgi:hypothetical protein